MSGTAVGSQPAASVATSDGGVITTRGDSAGRGSASEYPPAVQHRSRVAVDEPRRTVAHDERAVRKGVEVGARDGAEPRVLVEPLAVQPER